MELYKSSGRLHLRDKCPGGAPVKRMRAVEKSADELAAIWRKKRAMGSDLRKLGWS
jgi:hypothetical protein